MQKNKKIYFILILTILLGFFFSFIVVKNYQAIKPEITGKIALQNKKGGYLGQSSVANNLDIEALSKTELVTSLPKNAVIELKIGKNYYTMQKNSVTLGRPLNPDLTITLPESYSSELSRDICGVIKKANAKNELLIELHLPQAALLWKYKNLAKYKDCLNP